MKITRSADVLIALIVLFVLLGCVASAHDGPAAAWMAENVVILVMDGVRWSESFGDPQLRNIPELAAKLAPQGVVCAGFRNAGRTETNPGHAALVTGFYEPIANTGSELPRHATILQRFLKASGLPKERAWLVTAKDKLQILSDTSEAGWAGTFACARYCGLGGRGPGSGYEDDEEIAVKVREILKNERPRLVVVNFRGCDSAGHSGNWQNYLRAIRDTDRRIGGIFDVIASDPFYSDRTAVFVTNDHGRHDDQHRGFSNHGDDCEGCRHLMLLAVGPDFGQGVVAQDAAGLPDVAVTAAAILGFEIPGAEGRVMSFLRADSRAEAAATQAETLAASPAL